MLHGYGDNAANFMHLAHPIDQNDWMARYIALNGPGFIPGNFMGYQWFDLYPNGIYIADAGPREFQQIQKEIDEVVTRIIYTMKQFCDSPVSCVVLVRQSVWNMTMPMISYCI